MRSFLFTLITTLTSICLHAQSITGDWYGLLDAGKAKLHIVFHISKTDSGYSSTMDSPDQGAKGIKTDATIFDGKELIVEKKAMGMKYTASCDAAITKLSGIFQQGQAKLPLNFSRTREEIKVVARPQDPTDFPYTREEVTIQNIKDSVTLAGTLTLPKDKKADKIVILITGSGPQNRDEEIKQFNHRPFLVWSDWLTRHGIAVLRYDDRGVAGSTGSFKGATSADFANDAKAAVDYIASRDDLKGMKIGLMGHSEGGMIAPMVAAKDKRVRFLVLLAGPGAPVDELMAKQIENGQASSGVPKNVAALNVETSKMVYAFLKEHPAETNEQIQPKLKALMVAQLKKYPADALQGASVDTFADEQVKSNLNPWFRYFIAYIPADNLKKVKCPVLAVNGSLDKQVDAEQNLTAIETALKKAKNKDFETVRLEGLNHLLQKAKTGNPDEYGKIEETVNPAALDKVTDWLTKH